MLSINYGVYINVTLIFHCTFSQNVILLHKLPIYTITTTACTEYNWESGNHPVQSSFPTDLTNDRPFMDLVCHVIVAIVAIVATLVAAELD